MEVSSETIDIELTKPVFDGLGKPVPVLKIRCPTARDIMEVGFPYVITRNLRQGTSTEVVEARFALPLIAKCAGVPLGAIEGINAVDTYQCMEALRLFFHYRTVKPADKQADGDTAEA